MVNQLDMVKMILLQLLCLQALKFVYGNVCLVSLDKSRQTWPFYQTMSLESRSLKRPHLFNELLWTMWENRCCCNVLYIKTKSYIYVWFTYFSLVGCTHIVGDLQNLSLHNYSRSIRATVGSWITVHITQLVRKRCTVTFLKYETIFTRQLIR